VTYYSFYYRSKDQQPAW